jgi:predicted nucleotidyltransferase component of viral defense system
MRDFYDIWMLLSVYEESIDSDTLQRAFAATCKKRETEHLLEKSEEILSNVEVDSQLQTLWKSYQKKFTYATNVTYEDIICSARKLLKIIK